MPFIPMHSYQGRQVAKPIHYYYSTRTAAALITYTQCRGLGNFRRKKILATTTNTEI